MCQCLTNLFRIIKACNLYKGVQPHHAIELFACSPLHELHAYNLINVVLIVAICLNIPNV